MNDTSCSCSVGLFPALYRDLDRCVYSLIGDGRLNVKTLTKVFLLFPGATSLVLYRLTHHFYYRFKPHALGKLLYGVTFFFSQLYSVLVGIEISPHAHLGSGLFINHFGGIHIGPVHMGENCNLSHGVTFGYSSRVTDSEMKKNSITDAPGIGNRVWVGPGSLIAGPVSIGDDSVIGGNSLVTRDVPRYGVVIGVPAKVVSYKGSFRQVTYRGMADDQDRSAALAAHRDSRLAERRVERE
jgi:serine O-acetyltransferase